MARALLLLSGLPAFLVSFLWIYLAGRLGGYWQQRAVCFPSPENEQIFQSSFDHYLKTPKGWVQLIFPVALQRWIVKVRCSMGRGRMP